MFITVEEMYAMKETYDKQIVELEMKKAVVCDFIALAEAKEQVKSEEEIAETEVETATEPDNSVGY